MKCKFCNAGMKKGTEVCPFCGKKQIEPPVEVIEEAPAPKKKVKTWQIVVASVAALVLLLSLTVVVYWSVIGVESFDEGVQSIVNLFKPRENDVLYKDSYTVSDKKAADKREEVVATIGDRTLTNGQLQVYYWMNVMDFVSNYGYYVAYMGLDVNTPLDKQMHPDMDMTWQQFFLDDALDRWHYYQSMALMAEKEGLKLDEETQKSLDELEENMTKAAMEQGFATADKFLQADMGPGCTFDDFKFYREVYYKGYLYFTERYDEIKVTDEMLEEYFTKNEAALKESGITKTSGNMYDVRHILIKLEGGKENAEGEKIYTDAEWAKCKEEAEKLLQQWLDGEHTEETFAELANKHSDDTGSNTNGGMYTDLNADTNFVEEFVDWYMDKDRKVGDYGLIKTEYGYHVMYCSEIEAEWIRTCRDGVLSNETAKFLQIATETYPMEVNYKDIVLGFVDLTS